PFINCINCGPRYSIIQGIPYDRPQTTMRRFVMCEACRAEYENPQDRRFHAQPNACEQCGPQVVWETGGEQREKGIKAICEAAGVLRQGGIVAVKGLGGFHLACRADDAAAVARLRERKGREAKPFALMVEDLAAARSIVAVDETSARLLTGWRAPILLLPRLESSMVAPNVAPGIPRLGVMLAYTPLHVLLLRELPGIPMIMTSANPSEEPLCKDNDEARVRMAEIADGFLMHNRDIARRVDDSVVLYDELRKTEIAVRRSRGYVPQPFYITDKQRFSQDGILAFGGDLKAVLAIAHDDQLVLSEHLGDLENPQALRNYLTTLELFKAIVDIEPKWGGCDLHPGYFSMREAHRIFRQREGQLIGIQHHHAHVEAVRVEYALEGPLLGLAVDGTGYGLDKTIWGGEILLSTGAQFERPGHLHPFYLPGGDQSAREVWRTGISLLVEAGVSHDDIVQCVRQRGGEDYQAEILLGLLAKKRGGVFCSSLGRLFDGAGWLI
ncbi:MAG: carbamoyltransferase HypF, partial [Lentisphaerae bacterium]